MLFDVSEVSISLVLCAVAGFGFMALSGSGNREQHILLDVFYLDYGFVCISAGF